MINHITIDRTMLKSIAFQNPSTLNPGTSADTIIMITAFITSVNKPSVKIFIGKVKMIKRGLINSYSCA